MNRLGEFIRYRELLSTLVVRDLKLRYRNSLLGFVWSLLNPLLMMLVFTTVFTVMMRNNGTPNFPIFALIGILAWNWCSSSVMASVNSVVGNAPLIKKVYFPREVLPTSTVLSNMANFLLALIVLFPLLLAFGIRPSAALVLIPVVIAGQAIFLLGLAFVLSAVNVFFRDTLMIVDVLVLAWFFLTPVFYRIEDLFPNYTRLMYWLNPMASYITSYRQILLNGEWLGYDFLLRTLAISVMVLVGGYAFFARSAHLFGEEL
ncbi:MAG: ABC transporter permease [Bacteroidetes bacterium]|nr:ABC transporter permease [Bacteroidota bacterium]MCL5026731.1 ABC transporter permease [Chloroflexota bacterium]